MTEVVIVNGPPGVGKTTVSRILARELPGTACIHGDHLRAFAPKDAREHLGGGSTFRAAAVLASTYLEMGAPRVLVDYVFLRRSHLAYFHEAFGPRQASVFMFTLWAPLAVVEMRERHRAGRSPLGVAVQECWDEIERNRSLLGDFVDASTGSASDLAKVISVALGERARGADRPADEQS